MAIFHLHMQTVKRSEGRSATAAAAYRAGVEIVDTRTGEVHDYTHRSGVIGTLAVLPNGGTVDDRSQLWNAAELAENRKNSVVAREVVVALPHELTDADRAVLTERFARWLADRHGVAVDAAIHAPDKAGDNRNHHAHLLMTTRQVERSPEGVQLGAKTRELDHAKTGGEHITEWRAQWEREINHVLELRQHPDRVSAAPVLGVPRVHLGPAASQIERRGGRTPAGDHNRAVDALRLEIHVLRADVAELDRQIAAAEREAARPTVTPTLRVGGGSMALDALKERSATAMPPPALDLSVLDAPPAPRPEVVQEKPKPAPSPATPAQPVTLANMPPEALKLVAGKLDAQIHALRQKLPDPETVAWQDERVAKLMQQAAEAEKQREKQRKDREQAQRQANAWRDAHKLQAKAHDAGLKRSPYLDQMADLADRCQQAARRLAEEMEHLKRQAAELVKSIADRVRRQQQPDRAQLDKLTKARADVVKELTTRRDRELVQKAREQDKQRGRDGPGLGR